VNSQRLAALLLFLLTALLFAQQQQKSPATLTAKLNYLKENAARQQPNSTPTVLPENEINSYLASGNVKLPAGVETLTTSLHPQQIIGTAKIDFDKVRAGRAENNPFLTIFTGIHDVVVDAFADGANGQALVRVNSASVDGVILPRFALELFVNKYVKPKYPNVGMETKFELPLRITTATVSDSNLTLIQR
jgi:hypothetical protein